MTPSVFSPFCDLVSDIEGQEDRDAEVGREESSDVTLAVEKDGKPRKQHQQSENEHVDV